MAMDRESEEIWRELRNSAPSPLTPPEVTPPEGEFHWKSYYTSVTVPVPDRSYWIGFCEGYEKSRLESTTAGIIVVSAMILAGVALGFVIGKLW